MEIEIDAKREKVSIRIYFFNKLIRGGVLTFESIRRPAKRSGVRQVSEFKFKLILKNWRVILLLLMQIT